MSRAETLAGLAEAIAGQVVAYVGECICHEGYTGRNLVDPSCCWHMLGDDFASETAAVALAWLEGHGWAEGDEEWGARIETRPGFWYDQKHSSEGSARWYIERAGSDATLIHRRVTAWAPVETGEDA